MKTVLSGQNEVGKSTVKRIILDVLNCHDENDREITGIRPHDENGVEIDDVDIVRAVTFEIDGKAKTLKKSQGKEEIRTAKFVRDTQIITSMMLHTKWLNTTSLLMIISQTSRYCHFVLTL